MQPMQMKQLPFSNLASVVYRRTYSRIKADQSREKWADTVERYVSGNVRGHNVPEAEIQQLIKVGLERKAIPAGRGLWFSGTEKHAQMGGLALNNCFFLEMSNWESLILAQDLLMLGGGVGASVEHKFVSKLPRVKRDVAISHKLTKDAGFIVPDSREGWCELTHRVLESYFVTGKSFTYSMVCVRGSGELIEGFGGTSSGPLPVIRFIEKLCGILDARAGKHVRPIDVGDMICSIGEMVVSGNVRRSALLLLGDAWDKEYLTAKRWDLGVVPSQRSCANYSVVCDDVEDLHHLFWKTYEQGEPFGIVNRKAMQAYGRMGELKRDTGYGTNPCSEAVLEHGEACNLQEIALMNLDGEKEFVQAARLMHRYGKRVSLERYGHAVIEEVVQRNHRIGTGITGCLGSPLFNPRSLDLAYAAIQEENINYSKELNIPPSIRTTVIKPSGTVSKVLDQGSYEGIHPAFSRYMIQRVRFSSNDSLIPLLRAAGHKIEPEFKLDGTVDHSTLVVEFYLEAPAGLPVADEEWDTWKQLEVVKMAQKHWADQSVSVTVYYKKEDLPRLKEWLRNNLNEIKAVSFLCHNDHGFRQAPKEAITKDQYEKAMAKVTPINIDTCESELDMQDCAGGACPIK